MSRAGNNQHQLQFKTFSKSQIPQAFFSTHSNPISNDVYDNTIISQITLEFTEKINNLQSQIDSLRMEFNAQMQALNSREGKEDLNAYKLHQNEKEVCCFDSLNNPQNNLNHNHNHNHHLNLYNANILSKVKRGVLMSISNKSFCIPKIGALNYKEKLKIASNVKYKKNKRNRQNMLSYFSIRNEEKEKINRMILDANFVVKKQIPPSNRNNNTNSIDAKNQKALKTETLSPHSHLIIDNDDKYSSNKIQVISTIVIHNNCFSFKEKIKLLYLNREIKKSNNLSTLLNESCSVIYKKIEELSDNTRNDPFPSPNALSSLNLLSSSSDLYFKAQLKDINNDLALDLFAVIFLLLGQPLNPNNQLSSNELYNNLITSYNVDSLKDLFINHIVSNLNSPTDPYSIETKQLVVTVFNKNPQLITPMNSINDVKNEDDDEDNYKPFTYISNFFNEINLMFISDINRNKEILNLQQELLSFKDLIKKSKISKTCK